MRPRTLSFIRYALVGSFGLVVGLGLGDLVQAEVSAYRFGRAIESLQLKPIAAVPRDQARELVLRQAERIGVRGFLDPARIRVSQANSNPVGLVIEVSYSRPVTVFGLWHWERHYSFGYRCIYF